VTTEPGFLGSTVFMITIATHALSIMLFIVMTADVNFFYSFSSYAD